MKKATRMLSVLSLLFLTALPSGCYTSRGSITVEEGWEMLGQQKVNFVRDIDEIDVKSPNKFTAIRFRIENRDIRLNDLKIYFENGDKLDAAVEEVIGANQYSRDIQLSSEGRYIDKISFNYRTTGNVLSGRANLLVFGKRYTGF